MWQGFSSSETVTQAHGFLAQAAMLNAAAGRSPYGTSAPAFSDSRPTYSRDAQDEEAAPHSDISGVTLQSITRWKLV